MKEIVKRGIDSFRPGQMIVIAFPSMMDENFYTSEQYPDMDVRKELIKNHSCLL